MRLVRERFVRKVTYAGVPYGRIDWTPFGLVGVDDYTSIEVANRHVDDICGLVAQGEPLAITEFGCTSHRGAARL